MAEVLTLSTQRKRRPVVIDERRYDLLDRDEMPLARVLALGQIGEECAKAGRGELKPEQVEALCARLRAAVAQFMPELPQEVAAKLSDAQHLQLLTAFCAVQATPAPRTEETQPAPVGPC